MSVDGCDGMAEWTDRALVGWMVGWLDRWIGWRVVVSMGWEQCIHRLIGPAGAVSSPPWPSAAVPHTNFCLFN